MAWIHARVRDPNRPSDTDVFFSKVVKGDGCWGWIGIKHGFGYGQFSRKVNGKWRAEAAHRFSYQIHNGPIPTGMVVMHSCDNPECTNPDHLSVGTQAENTLDMHRKGRHFVAAGEKNGHAKLTSADVKTIRHLYNGERRAQKEIAIFFGVDPSTISNVIRGRNWK